MSLPRTCARLESACTLVLTPARRALRSRNGSACTPPGQQARSRSLPEFGSSSGAIEFQSDCRGVLLTSAAVGPRRNSPELPRPAQRGLASDARWTREQMTRAHGSKSHPCGYASPSPPRFRSRREAPRPGAIAIAELAGANKETAMRLGVDDLEEVVLFLSHGGLTFRKGSPSSRASAPPLASAEPWGCREPRRSRLAFSVEHRKPCKRCRSDPRHV